MTPDTLVRMANQIADFFKAQPGDDAVAGASEHIRRFWDPRMRREIIAHLQKGGAGLTSTARSAIEKLAQVA